MKRLNAITLLTVFCIAAVFSALPATAEDPEEEQPRNLTIEDYFRLKPVRDPQVSPDGRWVAYTVGEPNKKEDRWETRIWMTATDGGEAIRMTSQRRAASRPRWSPDGKYLAFLAAEKDKKTQVWTLFRQGGEAQQLTRIRQGVSLFAWSPDGTQMVLVIQDPTPEDIAAEEAEKEGKEYKKPKTRRPYVIDRLQFKRDYRGYLDRRRTHLYIFDVASRTLTQITSGDYDDSQPVWSPDGRYLAFTSNRSENPDANYNTDIWVVAAGNADKGQALRQVTTNPGADRSPAWSPDGKWIASVSETDVKAMVYATPHLAISSAEGGSFQVLTAKLDRHVYSPKFSPDGKHIYFLWEDSGERHLARVRARLPANGGALERPIAGQRSVRSFEFGPAGEIVAVITEPHLPAEVFLLREGSLQQLTSTNKTLLAKLRLAEIENIHYQSTGGAEIEGFIYKPPGFEAGRRYPTLLRIHGGPISQFDFSFNFNAQLFAAHGYVVVMVNPRGSSGYGQKFSLELFRAWGIPDFDDVMAGVDYAIAKGYSDPEKLGVGGWSYGGILTNYVITKTGRFQGAISGASEVLLVANYGHDHYQRWWEQEFGLPWEDREIFEKLSAFNDVDKVTTPTLVIGGEEDWNVPIQNSEQLYQALKRLGVETQLVVYPGEHHGIRKLTYQKDRLERYLDWYARTVKGEKPGEKTTP